MRTLFFGTKSWVYRELLERRLLRLGKLLFRRALRPTFHPPHMGAGSISDNTVQPGGELGATLELVEIPERQEKSLLQSIFGILRIAQHLSCCPLKARHAGGEKSIQLDITHIHRQGLALLQYRDCTAIGFVAQVTPLYGN